MASAYTPGLQVTELVTLSKLRELPVPGDVLVELGQRVESHTAILAANRPGEIEIVRLADRLGLLPEEVIGKIQVKIGDRVSRGDILCQLKTFFGFFTSQCPSPIDGTVEFITEANAHLGIRREPEPLSVDAYVDGYVTDLEKGKSVTVTTWGGFIQGVFGVGGEKTGVLFALPFEVNQKITKSLLAGIDAPLSGAIIIGGASFDAEALDFAASSGVVGVVTGSILSSEIEKFLRHTFNLSITGDEALPLSLVVTEGFGEINLSPRVFTLAKQFHGLRCSCNGATQVRAGAVRPEVIIPRLDIARPDDTQTRVEATLSVGARVRLIRVPFFGQFADVLRLPTELTRIETGALVRVVEVRLDDGQVVLIPRANIELV